MLSLPFSDVNSMMTRQPMTSAPHDFRRLHAAVMVPPVAIRSSTIKHFRPGRIEAF